MKKTQRWLKVGIEIEGAWDDVSKVVDIFKGDGSVGVEGFIAGSHQFNGKWNDLEKDDKAAIIARTKGARFSGEIASNTFSNKKEIKKFIDTCYPVATNYSCGLHIHVSFPDLFDYAAIMTSFFHQQLLSMINKFGDKYAYEDSQVEQIFWSRFMNQNTYCRKHFDPLIQGIGVGLTLGGQKYRMMNYGAFDHARRTFECRAFPAFGKKETAYKAIESFLDLINNYLNNFVESNDPEIMKNMVVLKSLLNANEPLNKEL